MASPPGEKTPYNFCEVTKTKIPWTQYSYFNFIAMIRHNDQDNL